MGFQSRVRVRNLLTKAPAVDAKSILGVLGLGVGRGGRIEVTAEGEDEQEALDTLGELVANGLGEAQAAPAD